MPMTPREQLQAIQERADSATPGSWRAELGRTYGAVVLSDSVDDGRRVVLASSLVDLQDAEFIAHARTDIPRLVAACRDVLTLADAADAAADQVMTYGIPSGRVSTIELRRTITEAMEGLTDADTGTH